VEALAVTVELRQELRRILVLGLLAIGAGWLIGYPLPALTLFFAGYLLWHLVQLSRALRWLNAGAGRDLPQVSGVWAELVNRVHRIQQRSRKRKKRLAKMLNRFQKSTKAMPDATAVLKVTGEIEWANRAAERLLGLSRADTGRRITHLVRDPELVDYLEAGDFEQVIEIPSPVDESVILNIRVVPFAGKQLLLIARDVTRILQLEAMRKDFVANVSHELRTPLTVLSGYLEVLDDAAGDLPHGLESIVPPMLQQTRRMNSLINDLLFLSRLERGDMDGSEAELQPVDIPAMLRSLAENAEVLSGEASHRIEVRIEDDLWLLGRPAELESAFSNIISNAVRYTPAGGRINIAWWADAQGAHLSVSDTGIGIDEEDIPRLTERFYRVNKDRSRDTGGTGLGLAIVKHVMVRHEARLEVESELDLGSEFRCDFPSSRIHRGQVHQLERVR
jgi:two-component system phosphate regulon sensor histidine kinase PhoR